MTHKEIGIGSTSIQTDVRPRAQLDLGFELAEQGGIEGAIRAFQAALCATLESKRPEDLGLRRAAATQLVELLRKSADESEASR
jgi:hypothetical protein